MKKKYEAFLGNQFKYLKHFILGVDEDEHLQSSSTSFKSTAIRFTKKTPPEMSLQLDDSRAFFVDSHTPRFQLVESRRLVHTLDQRLFIAHL